jgi:signal transduction histidine kinase
MTLNQTLEKIRQKWISEVSIHLTSAELVRKDLLEQLSHFFDSLQRSIDLRDPKQMDQLLLDWVNARTETELETPEGSLLPVLSQIQITTFDISAGNLSRDDALEIQSALLPIFTHAMEFASTEETRLHVQYITTELEETRTVLEKLERSKSDFISVAAHELKTPLTLIEGYISMLRDVLPEDDPKKSMVNVYVRGVHAGTRRLREIVDDMIDVSMIDNNLLALNFQPLWLNHLFDAIKRELEETIFQRKLNLSIKRFPGSEEMFFGDGERLYQAFRNVITNGIKYTPDGGSIIVDGRLLPGFIEVTIADTGIGIDPENNSRIFEKFGHLGNASLHSSGKTKYKGGGAGLGLPITKGIIDAHGGAIWVESLGYDEEKFPGSTFHVMLPLRKTPPNDKTAKLFKNLIETNTDKVS